VGVERNVGADISTNWHRDGRLESDRADRIGLNIIWNVYGEEGGYYHTTVHSMKCTYFEYLANELPP
jgi:hypothetical protein